MAGQTAATARNCGRAFDAPFASELQDEVPTHGKPSESETADLVLIHKILGYRRDVARQAGVIERGGFAIRTAAVALIHADDVHA